MPQAALHRCLALLLLVSACGGREPFVARVDEPFTEADAPYFQDDVGYVADPTVLEGEWLQQWSRELQERVARADIVAVVTITTLGTDVTPGGHTSHNLTARIERVLWGDAPDEGVVLSVDQGEPGFGSVDGNAARIIDRRFVMYLKWYESERGTPAAHWHLSPATEALVESTETFIQQRQDAEGQRRSIVVEH